MTEEKIYLCQMQELVRHKAKGFSIDSGTGKQYIFLVHRDGKAYGYINRCPHTGVSLDWVPDQFLDVTEKLIQCATHGAQFRIEDGLCVYGPCYGNSLTPVPIAIQDNQLFLLKK